MVSLKKDTGGIKAPAVTLGARNPDTDAGWKGKLENVTSKVVERVCNFSTGSSIERCIEENTYNQQELIITRISME